MGRSGFLSKRPRRREQQEVEIIEDLDLDVEDCEVGDDDVAHDRRGKVVNRAGKIKGVLPADAHKLEGFDDDDDEKGAHLEEEKLALEAGKDLRKNTIDSDFDICGIYTETKRKGRLGLDANASVAPVLEAVERDYAALTSLERLSIVQKESPEMMKMLEEMRDYLVEVKALCEPLQELLFRRRLSTADRNLVQFLETKVQLMLSYCMHVTFYLLMKSEGIKVSGHPVIGNLVEIRVYLEKLFHLEEKLQYSLNRLLSGKATAVAHLDTLRPVKQSERVSATTNKEAKKNRKQLEAVKEAEEIEREEMATMNRIHTKRSSVNDDAVLVDRKEAASLLGYHEDEDQFFMRLATAESEEDGEEGLSLVERLRKRQRTITCDDNNSGDEINLNRNVVVDDDDYCDEECVEEDELLSEGVDEEGEYEMLLGEERERQKHVAAISHNERDLVEHTVERRKTSKKIETHRGLTKSRPRDRKTPRTAQRRKYEKGLRIHKAQTRTVRPEPEGGFVGVPLLKSRVTQSVRFQ